MAIASGMPQVYRTFLLTPEVARDLAKAYPTKDALEAALVETARMPLAERAWANYYGNPGSAKDTTKMPLARHQSRLAREEGAKATPQQDAFAPFDDAAPRAIDESRAVPERLRQVKKRQSC